MPGCFTVGGLLMALQFAVEARSGDQAEPFSGVPGGGEGEDILAEVAADVFETGQSAEPLVEAVLIIGAYRGAVLLRVMAAAAEHGEVVPVNFLAGCVLKLGANRGGGDQEQECGEG